MSAGDSAEKAPLRISGIYPHLAVFNGRYDAATDTWHGTGRECGIGAIAPWLGKLWLITYPPHATHGSPDKLWTITPDLRLTMRPESVGGTHACRMVHRETRQLIIGPYFVDEDGDVRACDVKSELVGRMTAVARHLTDPANRVYFFDMEGAIYEVNVHTLAVTKLFEKPVPGWHGKGGYTGQGRLIIANNGEHGPRGALKHLQVGGPPQGPEDIGCLAEWDGETWRIVERKQFLDVTGPGGLLGAPDAEAPVWAIGWDRRSCILKLRDAGTWHTFRLPKATHAYDPAHGWYTEWPRIREVTGGTWLMDLHGMFYDFPPGFRLGHTGGLVPLASHLRYIPDFCAWRGQAVLAADDASVMGNPLCRKAQSNLWFGSLAELRRWGPRSAWGGPWVGDRVRADEPSEPFLIGGFAQRCLHLSTNPSRPAREALRTADKFPMAPLPDRLAGLTRVVVSRGDFHEPAPAFAFSVNQSVVVHLAVDGRGTADLGPDWERTDRRLRWGGGYTDTVYRKSFGAGRVAIPGRTKPHNAAGHYPLPNLAFVQPAGADARPLVIADLSEGLGARVVEPSRAAAPAADVSFRLEIDRKGTGRWEPYETIALPDSGYAFHLFPPDLDATWIRLRASRDAVATAYFHLAGPRLSAEGEERRFAALARADETPLCSGLVCPAEHNTRLQLLAQTTDAEGRVRDAGYWEVDETLAFHRIEPGRVEEVRELCAVKQEFAVDAASVIMTWKGRRYRLPKGAAAFDQPFPTGWPRGIREVQSERYLANIHGTFYEMPRDTGVPHLRPVCTHNRRIVDFCSWRGLLVLSGTRPGAAPDGQHFSSAGGQVGLWFGAVDDLWALGKPVGQGGPWRNSAVRAGVPSDPYLMTNYDRKRLTLSHDAAEAVTFALEVDVDHRSWNPYKSLRVPPGEAVTHRFPEGYHAHWIRVTADRDCTATAWFVYE